MLFSVLSLLGGVSFSPSLFGQGAPSLPAFGTAEIGALTVNGLDVEIVVGNFNVTPQTFHYVFLQASEAAPSVTEIDANPDRASATAPPVGSFSNPEFFTLTHTFTAGGTCRLHGYFSDAGGTPSAVASSEEFTVLHLHAPSFDTPVVSADEVRIAVTNVGTHNFTLHYVVLASTEAVPDSGFTSGAHYGTVAVSSGGTADVSVSGLSVGSRCIFHAYFSDGTMASAVSSSAAFTVLHAPRFNPPAVSGADLLLIAHNDNTEAYTLHYAVTQAANGARDPGFTSGFRYNTRLMAGGTLSGVTVLSLAADSYLFYAYFSDGTTDSMVSVSAFTVLHAPRFSTPAVSGADLTLTVHNEGEAPCTFHYVILDATSDAPSTGFTSGTHYSKRTFDSRGGYPMEVSGLPAGTYRLHGYFEADDGADSVVTSSAAFTVFYAPRFDAPVVTDSDLSLTVHNDGPSAYTLHYVVLASTEDVPSIGFTSGATYDSQGVAGGTNAVVSVPGLSEGTYRFHAYFSSSFGDISAVVSSASFAIVTPPPAPQINSLTVTDAQASFNIVNPDPFEGYTLYYVFLEASEAAPTAQEIRDHTASVNVLIPTIPPSGTALTHTFSESGMYRLHAYFESTGGFRSDVTSSSNTIDVTVASSDFLPVLSEPVVVGSRVRIMITNNDAASYGLQVTFSPTSAPVSPLVVPSTIAGETTVTITRGLPTLRPGVEYEVRVVFLDATNSPSALVSSSPFVILPVPVFLPPVVGSTGAYLSILNSFPPPAPITPFTMWYRRRPRRRPLQTSALGPTTARCRSLLVMLRSLYFCLICPLMCTRPVVLMCSTVIFL